MASSAHSLPDAELLGRHLDGDSDAFRAIVERHQGAVCAVAYSICGNRVRSEDIAQDTFIAGWKQANSLKERSKLRSWLCGIARNLAHNALRNDTREPGACAEGMPIDVTSPEASPSEQAIASDREALLWSSIEGLPDMYREPLVLFYREGKDAASVARALDLTEEAVRQRLSRARAMLAGRMTLLVEETLAAGTPSRAFAVGVLMALPATPPVATGGSAPMVGAAAAGGILAKLVPTLVALPFLLSGLTTYLSFRAAYAAAPPAERPRIVRIRASPMMVSGIFACLIMATARFGGERVWPWVGVWICMFAVFGYVTRAQRLIPKPLARFRPAYEFRSRARFLGLPLVHVKTGPWKEAQARGWIAISDGFAMGGFLASAPISVAPVAMGGLPVGLIALGGFAFGAFSIGVASVGIWAAGLYAMAVRLSLGLVSVSGEFARGHFAFAPHANDALAHARIDPSVLSLVIRQSRHIGTWGCLLAWIPPLLVILAHGVRGQKADTLGATKG